MHVACAVHVQCLPLGLRHHHAASFGDAPCRRLRGDLPTEAVAEWLARGGEVDARSTRGGEMTMLMAAAVGGGMGTVELLLAKRATIDLTDEHGATALMSATYLLTIKAALPLPPRSHLLPFPPPPPATHPPPPLLPPPQSPAPPPPPPTGTRRRKAAPPSPSRCCERAPVPPRRTQMARHPRKWRRSGNGWAYCAPCRSAPTRRCCSTTDAAPSLRFLYRCSL